ncbi:hypothetical protein F8568_031785 [Actinomadura sp. LD22]|uniref:Uncharacterized protein n=1 Tax=Actinomadura physcomitrii TaxID=2650748 RepID=A0A6I4MMZ4_9ACTN|nr:hypothetical protein [Actinomadura physcomitrii]MWA04871.1 hypothetical protein [Actinomadura physcomitrii]
MARVLRHPLNRSRYYSFEEDGRVRVDLDRTGDGAERSGHFDDTGRWLDGDLKTADPQMCRYLYSNWRLARANAAGREND